MAADLAWKNCAACVYVRPQSDNASEEVEPWMVNAEQLPPLLQAYDTRIAELEQGEASQREAARSQLCRYASEAELATCPAVRQVAPSLR